MPVGRTGGLFLFTPLRICIWIVLFDGCVLIALKLIAGLIEIIFLTLLRNLTLCRYQLKATVKPNSQSNLSKSIRKFFERFYHV